MHNTIKKIQGSISNIPSGLDIMQQLSKVACRLIVLKLIGLYLIQVAKKNSMNEKNNDSEYSVKFQYSKDGAVIIIVSASNPFFTPIDFFELSDL
ncbi:MAG: hypothetical protein ACKO6Q_05900 [Bacteroidota bacterium]